MTSPESLAQARSGLQLRSTVKKDGTLELSLAPVPVPAPGPDEVVVRVEAAPINPSDLGLLFGPADMTTAKVFGHAGAPGRDRHDTRAADAHGGGPDRSVAAGRQRGRRRGGRRRRRRRRRRRCSARRSRSSAAPCTRSTAR